MKYLSLLLLCASLASAGFNAVLTDSLSDTTISYCAPVSIADTNFLSIVSTLDSQNYTKTKVIMYQIKENGTLTLRNTTSFPTLNPSSIDYYDTSLFVADVFSNITQIILNPTAGSRIKSYLSADTLQNHLSNRILVIMGANIAAYKDTVFLATRIMSNLGYPMLNGPYSINWYLFRIDFSGTTPKVIDNIKLPLDSARCQGIRMRVTKNRSLILNGTNGTGLCALSMSTMKIFSYIPLGKISGNQFQNAIVTKNDYIYQSASFTLRVFNNTMTCIDSIPRLANEIMDLTTVSTTTHSYIACALLGYGVGFFNLDNPTNPTPEKNFITCSFTPSTGYFLPNFQSKDSLLFVVAKPGLKVAKISYQDIVGISKPNYKTGVMTPISRTTLKYIIKPNGEILQNSGRHTPGIYLIQNTGNKKELLKIISR